MSHIALARKWRPQKFEDVIGQRGVVETLKNAITSGRLAQSFIFAGPRGVGKTTTARILARALNCVTGPTGDPCGTCDACVEIAEGRDIDVFEIDAATYTGIDAVREVIIEPLGIAPLRDRFKVFIIDEVHRLSKQSFDALLKSIEEPPPFVKFMMATTDLHAVPLTIQSRSQVFELKTLSFPAIREQLRRVVASEKVAVEDSALSLVARSAEGSMRDALSALDQVLAFTTDRVSTADVSAVLGLIGRDLQFEIAETVAREDLGAVFDLANRILESGFDLRIVCRELARLMRDLMVIKIDQSRLDDPEIAAEGERERLTDLAARFSREDLMRAFDLLSKTEYEIKNSSQPRHHFEMALVKWIHLRHLTPLTELLAGGGVQSAVKPEARSQKLEVRQKADVASGFSRTEAKAQPTPAPRTPELRNPGTAEPAAAAPTDLKLAIMAALRERDKLFFSFSVAQAKAIEIEGDSMTFTFAPTQKNLRVEFEKKRAFVEDVAKSAAGRKIAVVTREGQPAAVAAPNPAADRKAELTARAKAEPTVQAVLDVFGGAIEDVEEI